MTIGTGYDMFQPYSYYTMGNDANHASGLNNNHADSAKGDFDLSDRNADDTKTPAEMTDPDKQKKAGRRSSPEDCKTCKTRKYQDGSDENVSFKSAAHISPQAAGATVRAHENEHVNNAYKKAAKNNGQVVSASVSIHTAVCPECGRSYVSGGTTNTMIKYNNEANPYQKELKKTDAVKLRGAHVDLVA